MGVINAHFNGVTYKLAHPSDQNLAEKYARDFLNAIGIKKYAVVIDGVQTDISIDISNVWSSAFWVTSEPNESMAMFRN